MAADGLSSSAAGLDVPAGWAARAGRAAPPLLVAVVGLALVPAYRWGVGLDGLSYLSIAEHYAAGRWDAAINAYWSPLLSWLVAPLVAVGIEPLLAGTLVGVGAAVGAVVALRRLLDALAVRAAAADVTTFAATPFVLAAALFGIFADLLLAALLVAYSAEVLAVDQRPARAWRAGGWAALAALTKLYALPFVLAHLAAVVVWRVRPGVAAAQRRAALATAWRCAAVLLGAILAWSAVLSVAEGRPVVSTAAGYNVQLVAPGSEGNPIRYGGLLEPPHPDAVSVWEDPSTMAVAADGWTGSERAAAQRLIDNVRRNLGRTWDGLRGWGGILLLAAAVVAAAAAGRGDHGAGRVRRDALVGILAAVVVYLGGYQLLWVEDRYVWPAVLWAAALAGVALDRLPATPAGRRALAAVGVVLFLGVLAANLDELQLKWRSGHELAGIAADLDAAGVVGDRVADANNWQRSAILCFHLGCSYLGQPADTDVPADELVAGDADTYLVWGEPPPDPPGLSAVPVPGGVEDLSVYAVPE